MKFRDLFFKNNQPEKRNFLNHALSTGGNGGATVTPETALTFSAVYAAVRVISETISQLPLNYYIKTDNGREKHTASPLFTLLNAEPNAIQTKYVFFEAFLNTLLLHGNAYAHITRSKRGVPIELKLVHPDDITVELISGGLVYDIKGAGRHDASDIIHVPDMVLTGFMGTSRISYAKNNIALGLAAQDYGKSLAESGGRISGVLEHPGQLGSEAMQNLREHWQRTYHTGINSSFKTAVLEEGMSYKPIQLRPDEMAYLATRKFSILEISRIYRVPPHLLGDLERATFSNIEHQSQEFLTHTINPIATKLEQELNKKLIFENDKGKTYFEFNVSGLLRGDSKARAEYYAKLFSVGAISPNEIRRRENMNDSKDGNKYYVPMNYAATDKELDNE
tara:strand:+ start:2303 stop:3481 length:1179 start_codon:yes stop_codon:yes gene_type:complete